MSIPNGKGAPSHKGANRVYSRQDALGEGLKLDVDVINSQIQFLQGKILTIVEASITDKAQLKAVKDLINTAVSDRLMYVYQLCYPKIQMLTGDQAEALMIDKEVNGK